MLTLMVVLCSLVCLVGFVYAGVTIIGPYLQYRHTLAVEKSISAGITYKDILQLLDKTTWAYHEWYYENKGYSNGCCQAEAMGSHLEIGRKGSNGIVLLFKDHLMVYSYCCTLQYKSFIDWYKSYRYIHKLYIEQLKKHKKHRYSTALADTLKAERRTKVKNTASRKKANKDSD